MKLILFDVDGTLTVPRKKIDSQMINILQQLKLKEDIDIGFVGGSDLNKQKEQLGEENFSLFEWRFSENGVLAFKGNKCINQNSFVNQLGITHFNNFINLCLLCLSKTNCPIKTGTFIEYRLGMLNISPIGRACNQKERDQFEEYDHKNNIRNNLIEDIKIGWNTYLNENNLQNILPKIKFSIGGQISIDIFPEGWDKTYCLQFVEDKYNQIYFFGDKTHLGGNDYEIYNDDRVKGYHVNNYLDTIDIINNFFLT